MSLPDEGQLPNEREVIRRQARERRAMDAELCGMQGGVHENVIAWFWIGTHENYNRFRF
jgi:hypothetical protein